MRLSHRVYWRTLWEATNLSFGMCEKPISMHIQHTLRMSSKSFSTELKLWSDWLQYSWPSLMQEWRQVHHRWARRVLLFLSREHERSNLRNGKSSQFKDIHGFDLIFFYINPHQVLESGVDYVLVLIISLICLLMVALSILSVIFVKSIRKARATRGTYSPSTQEMFGNSAAEILKPPPEERLI